MSLHINFDSRKSILTLLILIGFISPVWAQVDSTIVKTDTVVVVKTDTVQAPPAESSDKPRTEFLVYGGVNFDQLNLSSNSNVDSKSDLGYHFGISYKRGKFFYWQVGARYQHAQYDLVNKIGNLDSSNKLAVNAIDIPLTAGINVLSFTNRFLGLRAFISAVPSFLLSVDDNNLNIKKDNLNSFNFFGQVGIGVNIAFAVLELGYNYGFDDLIDGTSSKPGQAFVSLGFRF